MKANKYLKENKIDYELVIQDEPTKDCDEAAKERGVDVSQIVKSLIIERNDKNEKENSEVVHALLPGNREISEKKFGENRMVPPEKSKKLTGFQRGTVHPFSTNIKHIVDHRLLAKEKLSFTTGKTQKGVIIQKEQFREALEQSRFDYKVKDISLHNEKDLDKLQETGLSEEEAKFIAKTGNMPVYLEFAKKDYNKVYEALEELERHNQKYEKQDLEKILETAENNNHLQKIIKEFAKTGKIPQNKQEHDLDQILNHLEEENPQPFEQYREGKDSALNFIIGKVMEKTQGKADPEQVKKKIQE